MLLRLQGVPSVFSAWPLLKNGTAPLVKALEVLGLWELRAVVMLVLADFRGYP